LRWTARIRPCEDAETSGLHPGPAQSNRAVTQWNGKFTLDPPKQKGGEKHGKAVEKRWENVRNQSHSTYIVSSRELGYVDDGCQGARFRAWVCVPFP